MKTRALLAVGANRIEMAEAEVPDPRSGELLIAARYSAISPGTELRCLSGRQPNLPFPFVPGYSMVGHVIAAGAGTTTRPGALVFCQGTARASLPIGWGAHIGHAVALEPNVALLPEGVDPLDAVLTKLAAIAYRGVRVADTRPHDEVAVVGLGAIGQFAARLHRLAGARVVAADLNAARCERARSAGIEIASGAGGLKAGFSALQPAGADVVVDSTGALAVLQQSIQLGRTKPWDNALHGPVRFVVQGSFAENVVFDYHEAFFREMAVLFPRDCQVRDLQCVLRLIADGQLRTRDLISEVCVPTDAARIYTALQAAAPGVITAVFDWS